MKRIYLIWMLLASLSIISCGGGSDSEPVPTPTPTVSAPTVVTTLPANDATDVSIGVVNVTVTYDKDIISSSDSNLQPTVTGGTLSGSASVSGKDLTFSVNCPDYETTVTITIPQGLVGVTGALAEEYVLRFTTAKKPETPTGNISSKPLTTNEAAVKLYSYFYKFYGQKVISSVMANVNWNNDLAEKVNALTGEYPAMNCYDFIHIYVPSGNGWINYEDITPVTDWVKAGGIVQLMWHFNVPLSETTEVKTDGSGVTCSPSETTFKASQALIEGTWENKWFYDQMDKVITVLLKLQEAGIAATWRPFHESAGNATAKQQASWTKAWFWWGYDGADTFKKMWIAMFDYFKQNGVENLIWIWTTQNYNGDSSAYNQDTDWYPGDAYCDMVARDLYGYNATKNAQEFNEIQATYPTKMVVLGECGWNSNNTTGNPQGDIIECWNAGAKWGHFMVWYDGNADNKSSTMVSDSWWLSAMEKDHSDIVIGRSQVKY